MASIDERVVLVVSVDDLVVRRVVEWLGEELDEALTFAELSGICGAVGIAMDAKAWSIEATRTRVIDLERAILWVQIGIGGLAASPRVRLEGLVSRVIDLVPAAHVAIGFKGRREA